MLPQHLLGTSERRKCVIVKENVKNSSQKLCWLVHSGLPRRNSHYKNMRHFPNVKRVWKSVIVGTVNHTNSVETCYCFRHFSFPIISEYLLHKFRLIFVRLLLNACKHEVASAASGAATHYSLEFPEPTRCRSKPALDSYNYWSWNVFMNIVVSFQRVFRELLPY